ncbi:hypothetical protein GCM10027442_53310 [Emticicia fontis]
MKASVTPETVRYLTNHYYSKQKYTIIMLTNFGWVDLDALSKRLKGYCLRIINYSIIIKQNPLRINLRGLKQLR